MVRKPGHQVKSQISSSRIKGWKLKTSTSQQTLRPAVYPICGVRPRPFSSAALLVVATTDLVGLIAMADVDSKRRKKAHKGAFPAMSREKCMCASVLQVLWCSTGKVVIYRKLASIDKNLFTSFGSYGAGHHGRRRPIYFGYSDP